MPASTVLVVSPADDPAVDLVSRQLAELGTVRLVHFPTDRYPFGASISFDGDDVRLTSTSESVLLSEVDAVWLRRIHLADPTEHGVEARFADAVRSQARATLVGCLAAHEGYVLDPFDLVTAAGHKPRQLRLARRLGLDTPATAVTNDPATVRRLAAGCSTHLVVKPVSALDVHDPGGGSWGMFTSRVDEETLQRDDEIRACPMIFQEEVPKDFEVRATVVGRDVYSVAVDPRASGDAGVDWRRAGLDLDDAWSAYRLPDDVAQKLVALVERFGLGYSAADFVVTPDGRHVFLESNPAGEWTWVDTLLDAGVARALAVHLADHAGAGRSTSSR